MVGVTVGVVVIVGVGVGDIQALVPYVIDEPVNIP